MHFSQLLLFTQVCIGELLFRCCQLRLEQSKYTAEAALQTIGKARDLQVWFGSLSFGYNVHIHVLNTAYV